MRMKNENENEKCEWEMSYELTKKISMSCQINI